MRTTSEGAALVMGVAEALERRLPPSDGAWMDEVLLGWYQLSAGKSAIARALSEQWNTQWPNQITRSLQDTSYGRSRGCGFRPSDLLRYADDVAQDPHLIREQDVIAGLLKWQPEALAVFSLDGRKLLERVRALEGPASPTPTTPGSTDVPPEAFGFVQSDDLRQIVVRDYEDLRSIPRTAAKPRLVLAGSVIEGVLMDALEQNGMTRPHTADLSFADLIKEATVRRLIRPQTNRAARSVKDYRNLVHPPRELKDGRIRLEDGDTAIAVMRLIIAELRPSGSRS